MADIQERTSAPPPSETWELPTRQLGCQVHVYDRLDSTNSMAFALARDADAHGMALLAREQTAGRGQHGRSWHAPPGSSVLLSVALSAPPELRRPALLTSWAAVAVAGLLEQLAGHETRIKWPNDVYVHDKKVCGILIEQRSSGRNATPITVAGIGLNVLQPAEFFTANDLPLGGSIWSVAGRRLDPDHVARQLVQRLDDDYCRLAAGDLGVLEGQWQARLGLLGRGVIVECTHAVHHGSLRDVTLAAVELDVDMGTPLRLVPESVRRITAVRE
jgi:BirA family biotin operon repressor/biotin-[acetyl-CoA-carboxylase] ligase